jgi:phosphoserine phosphatase RsbU/P
VIALKELVARLNREQSNTQDLFSSLGFALRSFTNLNHFLELIPMVASRVTKADGSALVICRPDGELRLERFHCSQDARCNTLQMSLEEATRQFSLQVAEQNTSLVPALGVMNALDERVSDTLGPGVQLFGATVLNRELERGRLYVFSYDPVYQWTEQRQKLVRFVADQTAVAIEQDELTTELRKKERLDRELEIGAEIQRQLFPRQFPNIDGLELAARCKTASRVGGDYYDFIPTKVDPNKSVQEKPGQERWGITIGDVMGKGVPAGLIMTMLRGMLRAEVLNGHSPGRILQHLNRVMYTDLENSNRFVTLFYSEYDPASRMLSYSNAAHNPPLLWRFETQTLHRLDTVGMLVGLHEDSQYEDGKIKLEPGDVVVFYTDGFTDAASPTGERFDEDSLIRAVQWACRRYDHPQRILETLFDRIQTFVGPSKQNDDDMTLVVMKVKLRV